MNVTADEKRKLWLDHIVRIRTRADKAAFAELFVYFAPRIKAFLIRSGASDALAEECVQDVMATVWQKSHQFDASRASVATWIFTISRNRMIDALRKVRRPEPEDLPWGPEPDVTPLETLALQQDAARLSEAMAGLPEKQRKLIESVYFGDRTHSQVAEETGLPLGTIKSRIRLALEKLRHSMGPTG